MLNALQNFGRVTTVIAASEDYFLLPEAQHVFEEQFSENRFERVDIHFNRKAGLCKYFFWGGKGHFGRFAGDVAESKGTYALPDKISFERLKSLVNEIKPDLVVCRYLRYAVGSGAAFLCDIPVVLDYDDIEWRVFASREQHSPKRPLLKVLRDKIIASRLEKHSRKVLQNFSHIWVASEEDQQVLGNLQSSVLPNIPILPMARADNSSSKGAEYSGILFVGLMDHSPNIQGLDHFLIHVWPHILRVVPNVKLRVAGKLRDDGGVCKERWRQFPNVEILGFVHDLDDEYEKALFTIAPVYWGGGTKIKVLESLGRDRTCVVTPHALYGLGAYLKHEDSLLCGRTDVEFAENCVRLVRDKELRHRLAMNGKHVVSGHFSVERFNKVVADTVRKYL